MNASNPAAEDCRRQARTRPGLRQSPDMNESYILTLSCPDRLGLVHAVSGFLLEHGGNIEEAAQYNDLATRLFFMRVQFACAAAGGDALKSALDMFAANHAMHCSLHPARQAMKTVLMVSREGHCLNDLLFRCKRGLLPIDIRAIISNHRDFYQLAASYDIPFHHIPVSAASKARSEARQYEIIESESAELVVLARYMQVLSNDLCARLAGRAINIHHSFLPSFKGAKPYYQAHERGVKLIGATAHYVTADLDEGPIIEQDVTRADRTDTVEALTARGRDTESLVLARAVKWHSEHRVLLNGHKTVVFR
jgi:formyltetrahydrofolate deformylase